MRNLVPGGTLAALSLLVGMGATPALASAKYVYKGLDYTYMYPSTGCLKTTMHQSMSIVLAAPLAANLSQQTVNAVSWVIGDGLHSFKDTAKKAVVPLQAQFTTDGTGKITGWSINSYYYFSNKIDIEYTTHSNSGGDYSADYNCTVGTAEIGSNFKTGTWKKK